MNSESPQTNESNPAWDRFATELKTVRAPLSEPPSPNEVARLLVRADSSEAAPRSRVWLPVGAAALVVAGIVAALTLRSEPETAWAARSIVASSATTTGTATETAADGRALFSLGDDTVGVGPASKVEVLKASTKATRLVLSKGSLAAHVDPARGKRNFDVETPLGRVHVVGTVFRVKAADETLTVEVQHGTVEVTHGSTTSRVTIGQKLVVKAGTATVSPRDTESTFDELDEKPKVVAPVPEPVVEVTPPPQPVVDEPADKEVGKKRVPPQVSKLSEWRSRAARGECGLVMAEVKKFLVKSPDDVPVRMTLADCQRRSGEKSAAVETYLKAASGKGADANRATLMAASVLHDDLSQLERALKLYDRYLSKGAESRELEASVLVRKARALTSLGKTAQAKAVLDAVVTKYADTPAAADALRLRQ